jgi:O-antigen/teichoic acid export membrane protein
MVANFFFIVSDRLLKIIFGLVSNVMLVSYLTPFELGTWNYVLSIATIAGAVSIFSGLDGVVIRDLAQAAPSERGRILGSLAILRLLAGAIATAGSVALVALAGDWQLGHLIFIISLSFFTQVFHTVDYFFQSQLIPKYSALVQNLTTTVGFAAKVGMIFLDLLNLDALCWILVLESCLLSAGYILVVVRHFQYAAPIFWRVDVALIRRYMRSGLALLASGMVGVVIARVSVFQIDAHFDRASVAVYSLYTLVFEAVLIVNYSLVSAYFPRIIVNFSKPRVYAQDLLALVRRQGLLWMGVVAGIAIMVLVGSDLVVSLMNPIYRQSLKMILLGLPLTALFIMNFNLLQFFIIPQGNEKHQLSRAILGLGVLLVSNALFFRTEPLVIVLGSIALSQLSMLAFTVAIFHKDISTLWRARAVLV